MRACRSLRPATIARILTREAGESVPGEAMRPRKRHLPFVGVVFIAAAAGALLAGGAAEGQAPAAAAIVAHDNFFRTIAGGPAAVTIAPGGHVDFAYPSGDSAHNVVFTGMKPSVCGISEGPAAGEAALLERGAQALRLGGVEEIAGKRLGAHPVMLAQLTGKRVEALASARGQAHPVAADRELAGEFRSDPRRGPGHQADLGGIGRGQGHEAVQTRPPFALRWADGRRGSLWHVRRP